MSVAFRRESDEEHKEPRFELPIPAGPNLVTARGLALIDRRVAELEAAIAAETEDEARETLRRDLRYWHTRQTTLASLDDLGEGVCTSGHGTEAHRLDDVAADAPRHSASLQCSAAFMLKRRTPRPGSLRGCSQAGTYAAKSAQGPLHRCGSEARATAFRQCRGGAGL